MRWCAFILCFAACTGEVAEKAPAGHERMLALLQQVRLCTPDDNPWLGDKTARKLREVASRLRPGVSDRARSELYSQLGYAELVLGNEKAAIEHFIRAVRLGQSRTARGLTLGWRPDREESPMLNLGVAYMRLGETENCCAHNTPDSCLAPIRGGGIHTKPFGSNHAIEAFTEVIKTSKRGSSAYLQAVWLLNIAHMTIGSYPNGVPAEHRIPPSAFESDEIFPRFHNVARDRGLGSFTLSGGAVADDFDNDGDFDLLVSTWDPAGQTEYFENDGKGHFANRTKEAGLTGLLGGLNMVQADYDNDGDVDVFVLRGAWLGRDGRHPNSLLRNDGGRFVDVTFDAGLGEVHLPTQTAAWGDYDNDGDVDLYVGNEYVAGAAAHSQLFRNNGDGTFTDTALRAGVANDRWAKAVHWGDFDNDGDQDLYVSNLAAKNRLYRNNGDGTFTDIAQRAGVDTPLNSFPAWFWDFDNDGNLDLFVSAYNIDIGNLAAAGLGLPQEIEMACVYKGDGKGGFTEVGQANGLDRPNAPMAANFGDLDHDGYLDFYLGTGDPLIKNLMPNVMYRNRSGKGFSDITTAGGFGHLQKGHAIVFADLDADGDQDVFEQMGGALPGDRYYDALYENPGFSNHWIGVKLVGVRSNRAGIGARIKVVAGGRAIYKHVNSGGTFGANPLEQRIGIGKADRIDRLEVFWPVTGRTQVLRDVAADRRIVINEAE